ncbi:MAG TPA: NUDIX hydrolase [Usitatibacter sp.]|nr:NUDIX hydrolase [Usitatibacter sp.]
MAKPPQFTADFSETTVSSELAYDGSFLKVYRDTVRLHDGTLTRREYVKHPGAVMILAFLDDETILLERQYRYPRHRHFVEIPAGKLEPGEPALATAKRELVEECGYEAGEWIHMVTIDPSIGYSTEIIELYAARRLRHVGAKPDVGEHLECFEAKIGDALDWVRQGVITDTKTTFALLWWKQWGVASSPP